MKIYIIYLLSTGKILRTITCLDTIIEMQYDPSIEGIIEGDINIDTHYVENNQIIKMPEKPALGQYTFNYTTKVWEPNTQLQILLVKRKRNELLLDSDWTDTVSASIRLGTELYNAWQAYRQTLRDISDQVGYPYNIVWPQPPA